MLVSIIIITVNEARTIEQTIEKARMSARFPSGKRVSIEIIVSDGGSTDETLKIAHQKADKVIVGPMGRYIQLNAGAKQAKGEILLFLHADTLLPETAVIRIVHKLRDPKIIGGAFMKTWNWNPMIKRSSLLKFMALSWQGIGNRLVRLLRAFPGDNAIFVRKFIYDELRGFRPSWICEDFDFSRRLKNYGKKRFLCMPFSVITSARRYEKYGFLRTNLQWFWMYWLWRFGMPQERLKIKFKKYSRLQEH
ncbi:MAG: glycosyltransferase [Candidatus Thorarchaeota archaeon]